MTGMNHSIMAKNKELAAVLKESKKQFDNEKEIDKKFVKKPPFKGK